MLSPSRPAPFLIARSSVSRGIEAFFACSTTRRKRGFMSGSAPLRAAIMISFDSLPKVRPLALAAASLCFAFHCAPMLALVVRADEGVARLTVDSSGCCRCRHDLSDKQVQLAG